MTAADQAAFDSWLDSRAVPSDLWASVIPPRFWPDWPSSQDPRTVSPSSVTPLLVVSPDEDGRLPLDIIERGSQAQLLVSIDATVNVDLAQLRPIITQIRGLLLHGFVRFSSLDCLADASNLVVLRSYRESEAVDCTGLSSLREIIVQGERASVAAAASRTVEFLGLSAKRLPADLRIVGPVVQLGLVSSEIPMLEAIENPQFLRSLGITSNAAISLEGIRRAHDLTLLTIDAPAIRGFAEVSQLKRLRQLNLWGARQVQGISALAELDLDRCEIDPNYVVDPVLRSRLKNKPGTRYIPDMKPLSAPRLGSKSEPVFRGGADTLTFRPFEVAHCEEGSFEISLTDFSSVPTHIIPIELEPTSFDVQTALADCLAANDPALRSRIVFDSEADAVHARAETLQDATAAALFFARHWWDAPGPPG